MNFIAPGMSAHEALQQALAAQHDPAALQAARRASDALQALLSTVGPELLAWSFMQANGSAAPTAREQRAGLEMFAASIEEARDAARDLAQ